ncbi:MAG: hypothetical protein ABJC79_15965 [Acidimicrobiia bacterium]
MPTDPYVPIPRQERPRQKQNFATGVHMPAARSWRADRPGDNEARLPSDALAGSPGPNVGFALTLARRACDRFRLEPGEHAEDAIAVVAELAMKRSASFGRAPTMIDVDFATELLGYSGTVSADVRQWRPDLVRGVEHDYVSRRRIADTVSAEALRTPIAELSDHLAEIRAALAAGPVSPPNA